MATHAIKSLLIYAICGSNVANTANSLFGLYRYKRATEVIRMAVSAISKQSEDKIMRQAYQRRKDDIYFHNVELAKNLQIA